MLVFLVDDHELFREGLELILKDFQKNIGFEHAGNSDIVIGYENKSEIDLILLDLHIPGTSGLDALTKIKQLYQCRIVMVSMELDPKKILGTISEGAAGFIPKNSSTKVLRDALHKVLAGGIYLPQHVLEESSEGGEKDSNSRDKRRKEVLQKLTRRQLEVLYEVIQGKPNKVIAEKLADSHPA